MQNQFTVPPALWGSWESQVFLHLCQLLSLPDFNNFSNQVGENGI